MTQPPSPSAAARQPGWYWTKNRFGKWRPDAWHARGEWELYGRSDGEPVEIGQRIPFPDEAAERAKPAASDHEAAKALVAEWGKSPINWAGEDTELENRIAATLAERGRVERERAVRIIKEFETEGEGYGDFTDAILDDKR